MADSLPRGRFIVVEGIDGAGTTTQVELVARRLRAASVVVHTTREPSDGGIGRFIRQQLLTREVDERAMAALFAADRLDHVTREIRPALARGELVLCDRYLWSSLTYQGEMTGDEAWVRALNAHALAPHLVVLVDVEADEAARRRISRSTAVERYEVNELQARLVERYRRLLGSEANAWRVDGRLAPEVLAEQIASRVLTL